MKLLLLFCLLACCAGVKAQNVSLKGIVRSGGQPLAYASVAITGTKYGTTTNSEGFYQIRNIPAGQYTIVFSSMGYFQVTQKVDLAGAAVTLNAELKEGQSKLNEVVVTGVSRATELRSNPVPIVVLSKKEIDQHVSNNIIDAIVKGIPGVTAVTTGPNISKPFIRGLGYNRVLTLYDGIRQEGQQWGDEHGIEVDQYGIARAEVIKGPASLTYGSDALAGVVNLIPYIPNGEDGQLNGDIVTDYHTNNGLIGSSLGLSYKKNDWKYAFRATGKMAHNYSNKIDGPVYNTSFREYILSGMTRVDKKWGYSQTVATAYENKQEIPDGSRDSLTRRFTVQVLDDGDDIKNRPVATQDQLNSYSITPLHQHIQHYRVYNKTEIKVGQGLINTALGWQQSVRREYNHPTQPSQAGLYVTLHTLNYDLRYSAPSLAGIETAFGVNGIYQTNRSKDATDFPIPDYNLFDIGAFFFAQKSIGKTDISGGLRYDTRNIRWHDFYIGPNPANGFEQKVGAGSAGSRLQFPNFDHNYHGVSGSLGLTYNINEQMMLKANIARGYRAPNITEIGSNGLDPGAHIVYLGNRSFVPEFSLQQDVGFIAYLKNFDVMLELFNNNIENYIYQSRLDDENGNPVIIVPGNTTYQYQQSKARLYGAEFTFNLHPQGAKWLELNNSLAYVVGLNKNKALLEQSNGAAKYLPFIPPLHARSELKIKLKGTYGMFSKIYLRAEVDAYANQNKFYALNDTETPTPGYTLINAGIGSTLRKKSGKTICELFLQADNLFDVAYQSNLNRLKYFEYYQSSPNGRLGIYNMGRNLSFKVIVPF
ncbi:TonB-dependent receptor [Mucilaginibacter pallidiroseus]|uniref:TonB-dependent receptor n=1 Tax=Mucilaginibacter pallidiroseus TaxID=2599295 RepID=A0A563UH82_9SPHI|nr:TonB-dependent receptor [Mucilaginibacter pallidiroseus]TWR30639.1 TonB-dependent receptor [Mucilaginibacter pallidiroseus]